MATGGLSLEIGDTLQLQFGDEEVRRYVKVIGYVAGRSLLVTTPEVDGKVLLVRASQPVVVRLMAGNQIVGFTVSVLCSNVRPYPYLHLGFPKDTQAITVRKALWVQLELTAAVRCCPNGAPQPAGEPAPVMVRDMSTSGALLVTEQPLVSEGHFVVLTMVFEVVAVREELPLLSMVRNIRAERNRETGQSCYLHGVEFRFANRRESVLLHAFVYEQIARGH